jgi:hypothetical protein
MRIVLCLFLVCSCVMSMAQDFPDTRINNKKEAFLRMAEKDIRGDISTFTIAGIDERIGKEPLKKVIPPVNFGTNYITFEGNNVKVTIKASPFEPSKHKLLYYDKKYLTKIDGKIYYGEYGSVPRYGIESITVTVDKDTVAIPAIAFADLYSPAFTYRDAGGTVRTHNGVYLSNNGHNIYIYMLNPETRGNYEVTWVIQDKKFLRRVVDTGLLQ